MCLIVIATNAHPDYPLIIAANRDEYFNRPTSPISFWTDIPEILAGRDLQGNGTWLGITRKGRIAAITNYRDLSEIKQNAPSRGLLVSDFLRSDIPAEDYLKSIDKSKLNYNGYNLVAGDIRQLWWYSNKKNIPKKIDPGIHAISNHLIDTPWPKVKKTISGLQEILQTDPDVDPENIFRLLSDTSRPADDELPDTGVGLLWERILSSVFVTSDIYGTRSSSVIILDKNGNLTFLERTFNTDPHIPDASDTKRFEIKL